MTDLIIAGINGVLYTRPELDAAGEVITGGEALSGFHVNARPSLLAQRPDLASRQVFPVAPHQVWYGDSTPPTETVFLRFTTKAAARKALGDLWPTDAA